MNHVPVDCSRLHKAVHERATGKQQAGQQWRGLPGFCNHFSGMFLTDVVVVVAILLFFLAVAIELRKDRSKKMYVGREAKSGSVSSDHVPMVPPESRPPVVTQEEFKQPKKSA